MTQTNAAPSHLVLTTPDGRTVYPFAEALRRYGRHAGMAGYSLSPVTETAAPAPPKRPKHWTVQSLPTWRGDATAGQLAEAFGEHIATEHRHDPDPVRLGDLKATARDGLVRIGRTGTRGAAIEAGALGSLRYFVGLPRSKWLRAQDAEAIAAVFNDRCRQDPDARIVPRLRRHADHGWQIHAVVSPTYQTHDVDAAVADMAAAAGPDSAAQVRYSGRLVTMHLAGEDRTIGGDAHRLYRDMSTADDGSSSIRIGGGAKRLVCLNGMTIVAPGEGARIVHSGRHFVRRIRAGLAKTARVMAAAEPGLHEDARRAQEIDASILTPDNGALSLRDLIGARIPILEPIRAELRDAYVETLLSAAAAEGADPDGAVSLWTMAQTVTRLHEERYAVRPVTAAEVGRRVLSAAVAEA